MQHKPAPPISRTTSHGRGQFNRQTSHDISAQFQTRLRQYKTFNPGAYAADGDGIVMMTAAAATNRHQQQQRMSLEQMLAVAEENIANEPGAQRISPKHANVATVNAVRREDAFAASTSQRVAPDPAMEDPLFLIWMKEHPDATPVAIRAEQQRRQNERLAAERAVRLRSLQQWQRELEQLQRDEALSRANTATEAALAGELDRMTRPLAPKPPPRGIRLAAEDQLVEQQKLAWQVFNGGDGSPQKLRRDGVPLQRVLETDVDPAMHAWVQSAWSSNTDRHERAALRIQCCFRVFRAKERVAWRRLARHQEQKLIARNEEQAMLAWEVAVAMQQAETATATTVDRTFKAVQVFSTHMKSIISYRRRANQRARDARSEVEEYAATRIQTIFRGYLARRYVRELRQPQLAFDREAHVKHLCAIKIQAIVRRHLVKLELARKLRLTLMLQQLFRRYCAIKKLAQLRKQGRHDELARLRNYAASVIQRNYRRAATRRRAAVRRQLIERLPQLHDLQCYGRAYCGRKVVAGLRRLRFDTLATSVQALARHQVALRFAARRRVTIAASMVARVAAAFAARLRVFGLRRRLAAQRTIAAVWRGHRGRCQARAIRAARDAAEDVRRQNDAATMIQASFRGHRARCRLAVERDAAEIIQTAVRNVLTRTLVENDAAIIIAAFYFNCIRRRALHQHLARSAGVIVRFLRRVPAYKEKLARRHIAQASVAATVEHSAALVVQQAVRQHQAKACVRRKSAMRTAEYQALREQEAAAVLVRFFRGLRRARGKK